MWNSLWNLDRKKAHWDWIVGLVTGGLAASVFFLLLTPTCNCDRLPGLQAGDQLRVSRATSNVLTDNRFCCGPNAHSASFPSIQAHFLGNLMNLLSRS
jgi:hypothetical protein